MMHIGVGVGDEVVFVKLFRARNVSKQGAIISAKISGDRGRAERIHSPLSGFPWLTRNGQVTSTATRTLLRTWPIYQRQRLRGHRLERLVTSHMIQLIQSLSVTGISTTHAASTLCPNVKVFTLTNLNNDTNIAAY